MSENQYEAQLEKEVLWEYERAKSDYIYVSKNYPNYYAVAGYIEAEQKAWDRFEKAYKDLQDLQLD